MCSQLESEMMMMINSSKCASVVQMRGKKGLSTAVHSPQKDMLVLNLWCPPVKEPILPDEGQMPAIYT